MRCASSDGPEGLIHHYHHGSLQRKKSLLESLVFKIREKVAQTDDLVVVRSPELLTEIWSDIVQTNLMIVKRPVSGLMINHQLELKHGAKEYPTHVQIKNIPCTWPVGHGGGGGGLWCSTWSKRELACSMHPSKSSRPAQTVKQSLMGTDIMALQSPDLMTQVQSEATHPVITRSHYTKQ